MALVDEESFASSDGMRAHDRHFDIGHAFQLLFAQHMLLHRAGAAGLLLALCAYILLAVVAVAVHVAQALQALLEILAKRFEGGDGAGEAGSAEDTAVLDRHLERVKRGQQARHLLVRKIAVPEAARVLYADRPPAPIAHVGDDQDFRMAVEAMLLAHVVLELAETPRESDLLRWRELLTAKDHDLVLEEGVRDPGKAGVVQGLRQVGTEDFGADVPADFAHADHGFR